MTREIRILFCNKCPKNLFGLFVNLLLPCKAKITLRGKNSLRNVNFMLVLKGLFGGSLKRTLQNRDNLLRSKITFERFSGYLLRRIIVSHAIVSDGIF